MINIFIIFVIVIAFSFLLYLNTTYTLVEWRYLFSAIAFFILVERIWETFFTSKEKDARKYEGDWTLILTSFMYFVACLLVIIEFFLINRSINFFLTFIGLMIYILSGMLRFWSVKTLGNQWAIHAVGKSKLRDGEHKLVKSGPYRYIRHPIYLGIMFELIGISIIFNSFYSLLFILFINIPLYFQRAFVEEKSSEKRFGPEYNIYKNEVPFIFPYKLFKR